MLAYLYAILILLLMLFLTIFVLVYISGLFEDIVVFRKSPPCLHGGSLFAYKLHEGRYGEAGYLFTEAASIAPDRVQCGIHFDIADETASIDNSAVGVLLTGEDNDDQERLENAGFQVTRLPPIEEALVASFPHSSFLSIRIGSRRVYAKMRSYMEEHDLKVTGFLELYDGEWIHYVGLMKDEDQFRELLTPPKEEDEPEVTDATIETLTSTADLPSPSGDKQDRNSSTQSSDNGDMDELEASFEKITTYPEPLESH